MNTWHEIKCPSCESKNFLNVGDLEDVTTVDPEGFKCWNCGDNFEFVGESGELKLTDEEYYPADPGFIFNRKMNEQQKIMATKIAKRIAENPEILDELRERIESEDIVDWD